MRVKQVITLSMLASLMTGFVCVGTACGADPVYKAQDNKYLEARSAAITEMQQKLMELRDHYRRMELSERERAKVAEGAVPPSVHDRYGCTLFDAAAAKAQIREDSQKALSVLHQQETRERLELERSFSDRLGGVDAVAAGLGAQSASGIGSVQLVGERSNYYVRTYKNFGGNNQ